MGEHDPVVLYDKDAHRSATDDGRTLRLVQEDEYEYVGGISEMPALVPPYDSRQVLLYRGQKFIPETVYIRPAQVLVTEWESMYSSAFTSNRAPFSVATFSPIVDDSLKLVGHLGWADGNDIIVPDYTVRNDRRFWSILQTVRLSEERQRLLDEDAKWDRARPFPDFPLGRPTTSVPRDPRRWRGPEVCNPRPPTISLETRSDEARRGPLKDKSTEETYRIDLELFVAGGGKAFVGRHFVQRGDASYLPPAPGVPEERVGSPRKPFSSGYEFLVLVDPEGHLQRVMGVRKNLYSHADAMMAALELALTMSVLLDIVPIAVVLLAAGVKIAMRVMIQAVKLIIDREAKEIMELAFEELASAELAAIKGGGVIPKEAAESAGSNGPGLFQKQRAFALEQEASKKEAEALATERRIATAGSPERTERLRAQAQLLRQQAAKLRGEAARYASGAKSATADLPTAEEIEKELDKIALGEGKPQKAFRIPLAAAERTPGAIARLQRSLQSTARGRVVFRVEGGGSMPRLSVDAAGNVSTGSGTLNLNFGSLQRALEFLAKRGPGARIISFEVDESWVQSVRSAAMPEHMTGALGRDIRLVDVSYADDQMQIPEKLLPEMEKFIIPGSGKILIVN
jgi:hypothetical protein